MLVTDSHFFIAFRRLRSRILVISYLVVAIHVFVANQKIAAHDTAANPGFDLLGKEQGI